MGYFHMVMGNITNAFTSITKAHTVYAGDKLRNTVILLRCHDDHYFAP